MVDIFAARIAASPSGRGRSLKRSFSVLALLFVAFSLVACASRPETGFLSAVAYSPPGAVDHTLLVATTRERDDRPGTLFNGDRATTTSYAELTVSIPPNHKQGEIEWATTPPGDPNVDYVVRDEKYLDGDKAFVQALNAQLALRPPGSRKVFLFIHGFNTMFAEASLSAGAARARFKSPGRPGAVHLGLARKAHSLCLRPQQRDRGPRRLSSTRSVFCSPATRKRSMCLPIRWAIGSRSKRSGRSRFPAISVTRDKIGNVFLAAPDIDIDVFKAQMRRFGKPHKPFYIILSEDDRALFLSRTIAGGVTRVGDNPDVAELAALGATVIDLTDLKATDATNHDKFVQLAAVAPQLQRRARAGMPRITKQATWAKPP